MVFGQWLSVDLHAVHGDEDKRNHRANPAHLAAGIRQSKDASTKHVGHDDACPVSFVWGGGFVATASRERTGK